MIRGIVNDRNEAIIVIRIRGQNGPELVVDAVVDSGFSSSLTLPAKAVASLGLVHHSDSGAVLADGSVRNFGIYAAELEWDGSWRPVLVSAVGNEVLVGMRLLVGHQLAIEVVPGGSVEITPLP